ncbi:MAG: EscU/YscU/HrcU family type III secretion system export apparatus switch protein [Ilumatobacteraceae bacterium]
MASNADKTEAPTAKRRKDSRKKGQVAKSSDLAPWLALLVGTYVLPFTVGALGRAMQTSLGEVRTIGTDPDPAKALDTLGSSLVGGFLAITPILLVCALVSVAAQLAQSGLLLTAHPLKPDFKRLNPIAGVKRLLSVRSVWETAKQVAKAVVIGVIAWPRVASLADELTRHGRVPLVEGVASIGLELLGLVRAIGWTVIAIAVADYAFQRRRHARELRMTRQEVRDEFRNSEGDPHVKQRIRALQGAMARSRMMTDVGTATVVVTNPTHVAVAIRYDAGGGGAPKVVASGADALAARIRERAVEAGVPIVEAPPLARAMWRTCSVGDEIPATLFEAVAKVLVFVRRIKGGLQAASVLPLPRTYQVDAGSLEQVARRRRRSVAA